jgi:hypothetical protein
VRLFLHGSSQHGASQLTRFVDIQVCGGMRHAKLWLQEGDHTSAMRSKAPLLSRKCSCLVPACLGDLNVHSTPSLPKTLTRPSMVATCKGWRRRTDSLSHMSLHVGLRALQQCLMDASTSYSSEHKAMLEQRLKTPNEWSLKNERALEERLYR